MSLAVGKRFGPCEILGVTGTRAAGGAIESMLAPDGLVRNAERHTRIHRGS
jgi:hypothetical protein